jgi:hypothetical protein
MSNPRFTSSLIKTSTDVSSVVWNSWLALKVHLDVLLSEKNITEDTHRNMVDFLMDIKPLVEDAVEQSEYYENDEMENVSQEND